MGEHKNIQKLKQELKSHANHQKAQFVARYFKTGKGEYGQGDVFLGLTVPQTRAMAYKYVDLPLADVQKLLANSIHEVRQAALMILGAKFKKANDKDKKIIFDFYLKNTKYINNWDLIDGSAPIIVGDYLIDKPKERKILYKLVKSQSLWQRRISILATYAFIKQKDFQDTLTIAEILLKDPHDLIHKAVGWMLREVGKVDQKSEEAFLSKHYKHMPRTMLRYAIERFSDAKRKKYLASRFN